jgi:hypothetical protein
LWVTQPLASTGNIKSNIRNLCRMTGDCDEASRLQVKYPSGPIPQILARVNEATIFTVYLPGANLAK